MMWVALSWFAAFLALALVAGYARAVQDARRLRATIAAVDAERALVAVLARQVGYDEALHAPVASREADDAWDSARSTHSTHSTPASGTAA